MPTDKDDSHTSTVYLLKRTELAVRGCLEVALMPFGLTPTQLLMLVRLKRSSEGLSGAELARAAGVRPQSITDLVGPLERDGLITRRESPEHKRILKITLSPAGEHLLERAFPVTQQLEQDLLGNLEAAELERLREGLLKLLANAETRRRGTPEQNT
jgi:DNA-binding MarR family transcriptional regulator